MDDPCSTPVTVSDKVEAISIGEAGDGEEPGEEVEQPSEEEGLIGEQETDDNSQLAGKYRLTAWLPWRWDSYMYITTACIN